MLKINKTHKTRKIILAIGLLPVFAVAIISTINYIGGTQTQAFEATSITPNQGLEFGGQNVTIDVDGLRESVNITQIAAGGSHSLALDDQGNLYAWGYNNYGQIGNNTTTRQLTPLKINGNGNIATGTKITAISAGSNHSLALDDKGNLYAWGYNYSSQIGKGTSDMGTNQLTPLKINGYGNIAVDTNITAIAAGSGHSLALDDQGNLYAWGGKSNGRIGNGSALSGNQLTPLKINGYGDLLTNTRVVDISTTYFHSLALDDQGNLYAWGDNYSGQIGNGSGTNQLTPLKINDYGDISGANITAMAVGNGHSLALDEQSNLYAWGYNYSGGIGNNTTTNQLIPLKINDYGDISGANIVTIAAYYHSLALDDQGNLYAWGSNSNGQIGNGTSGADQLTPLKINDYGDISGANITAISAGSGHSLALDDRGGLYAWGSNSNGQIGNNTATNQTQPAKTSTYGDLANKVSVAFDDSLATNVFKVGNTITATIPAHAAGTVDIVISDSTGQSTTIAGGYTYIEYSDQTKELCYEFDDYTGTVTGYSAACPRDASIPSDIDGTPVTAIGEGAFSGKGLTSVVIPDSVTDIGNSAFSGNNISTLTIGNGLQNLGNVVFSGNPLKTVTIGTADYTGDPHIVLNNGAFSGLGIETLNLGNSVETITNGAFSGNQLTSLTIPDSVTTIGASAFSGNSIHTLVIGDGVESIYGGPFNSNSLKTITFGTSAYSGLAKLSLEPGAFSDSYPNLETVVDNGIIKGYSSCFANTPKLTTLDLTRSQAETFANSFTSAAITDLFIPNSVVEITNSSFGYSGSGSLPNLKTITFGTSDYSGSAKTVIHNGAFTGSYPNLETITDNGIIKNYEYSFSNMPTLTTLDLTRSQAEIFYGVFTNAAITDLFIPNSASEITNSAFGGSLPNLKTVTFGTSDYLGSANVELNNGAFSGELNQLTTVIDNGIIKSYSDSAFYKSPNLTTLDLTRSQVESFSGAAFSGSNLTSLFLPEETQSVDSGAFTNTMITDFYLAGDTQIDSGTLESIFSGTGEIIRFYTTDPTNPYGYTDTVQREATDVNGNGVLDIEYAYLVNPSQLTTNYLDISNTNNPLLPPTTQTGPTLTDYSIESNPTADFSLYYRTGDTYTSTPPTIANYITPDAQTITLSPGQNNLDILYSLPDTPENTPGAPNTGISGVGAGVLAGFVALVATYIVARRKLR